MSKSTGPLLVAGSLTWANRTILADDSTPTEAVQEAVRIGIATGLLAGLFYGLESLSPNIAVALAYTALVTTLLVRIDNKPTPLERLLDVIA